LKEEEKCQ